MGDARPRAQRSGPLIELVGATRRFGATVAVAKLDLRLCPGRIHALIGENGAGKSTALKLMAGHLVPSDGRVQIQGELLNPATPEQAILRGVGMVHQHFMLVERMTALDNLMLGSEVCLGRLGRLDRAAARSRATTIGEDTGLHVPLDAEVATLSVGERQRLEILRVLFRGARAVLLDEPTAVLSPIEVGELYATLRALADAGSTIAVVTHRLDEVVRYCDHVTVMRRGALVLDEELVEADNLSERLTRAIMGRDVPDPATPPELETAEAILRIDRDDFRLHLMPGEVVGIAGVEGNGQTELVRMLAGLDVPAEATRLWLDGAFLTDSQTSPSARVRRRRELGIVVVHEDRHRDELLMQASVSDNLVLGDLGALADEAGVVSRRFERFDVQPADPQRHAAELSGGNQQKLVMARALDRRAKVLVFAQPTRGVDVGTARTIHHAITTAAASGVAIIVVSADLTELRSLAHRIVVLCKSRLAGEFPPGVSDEELGRAMLGIAGTRHGDAA